MPAGELVRQLEAAFLPWLCRCQITHEDALVMRISDPANGNVLLQILGKPRASLSTTADLQRFVLQLRQELHEQVRLGEIRPGA